MGIAVKDGDDYRLLTGNHVGALLFDYICRNRIENGTMPKDPIAVTTIVSTKLTNAIGKAYGVEAVSYTHLDVYKRQPYYASFAAIAMSDAA